MRSLAGGYVNPGTINAAILAAIKQSNVPHIDQHKVVEVFGLSLGEPLTAQIAGLVQEAVSMPIEWGNMTLEEGVNDILR